MSPPPAGHWVPPPARATRAPLTANMLSPLKLRISEMEALASLMADSGLSAAGDTSPESRRSGDAPGARVRHAQPRPVRGRRRTNKASGSQRSRRAGLADDSAPVIHRRPDRDVAPPSAEAAQVALPSAARRPVQACSGQSASTSERLEPPPPPPPPERDADHGPTGLIGTFTTDPQLPPTELVPPLSELLPEAGASLHEVLEKFLWAKQQASAAANLMSSLRQAVERMDQDSPRQAVATRSAPGHDPAPPAPTTSEPACRPLPETGAAAARPTVTQTLSQTVSQAVTQAVTHSSLLATSCSMTGAPWPGSVTPLSAGSEDSASSAESVSVMPEESRSQLLPTATESRDSRRGAATGQGSELEWRSVSASDTAPGRGGPPPAAAVSQLRQVDALRRRYQRQQDKLRRLEQTNYVLNLAVDGQDKTIRTLSTQLEDTKEALLQEISQQPTPTPAAGRGDATQTGPSLVTLRAAREDGTQTAPDGGGTEGNPPPPQAESPGPPPGSVQVNKKTTSVACGDGGGLESAIALVDSRRPTLVETATSPVPEPEPEPDPEPEPQRQPEPGTGHSQREGARSEREETADERNEREVRRLLAALDAKERELASLRAERLSATPDRYLPDQAFISTPVSGVTRAAQPVSEWPGVPGVGPLSAEGGRRPAAAAPRAWSSEAVRQWAPPADGRTHRRHSFTAPAQREGVLWRPLAAEPARVQRSLLPEFEQVDATAGTRPAAAPHQEYDDECERLQEALNKGRSKIIQLEEEIFELKCARRRHGSGESGSAADLSRLNGSALLGGGGPGSGDPFPGIVRLTETKLQEAYQLLVRERQRAGQLTKQASEAAQRLEKTAAAAAELKQQLARSVQERQQLQGQLTAAETAGTELRQQLQKLREEVQSKDTQLARTSQHLDERVAQVSSLSRELEAAREEAVRQERAAAVRQDDLLTRVTQLEQTADALRLENKRLSQARDEAGQLAASERRLRQRVTELQERLDQSNNTAKMLENYIHFLKSSYNSMFGAPTAAGGSPGVGSLASSDGHGAARGLFHLSGK